jgi:hypothetical protein
MNAPCEQRLNYLTAKIEQLRKSIFKYTWDLARSRAEGMRVERNRQRRELGLPEV